MEWIAHMLRWLYQRCEREAPTSEEDEGIIAEWGSGWGWGIVCGAAPEAMGQLPVLHLSACDTRNLRPYLFCILVQLWLNLGLGIMDDLVSRSEVCGRRTDGHPQFYKKKADVLTKALPAVAEVSFIRSCILIAEAPKGLTIKHARTRDRGVPTPGPEEILVRVEAAGLNPVDAHIGSIQIPMWADLPTVPGAEAAGVIVAIGNEVKGFKLGDRVAFGTAGQKVDVSSYQQYSLSHSTIITKLPPNITLEEGASIPVGLFTSYHAMYGQPPHGAGLVSAMSPGGRGKYAGQPIVILGGAGATGHFALQIARLSGFSPIITTASLKHESFLKSLVELTMRV
ncbi:chaperonin 10-like protein [Mycena rosella]|uniref:Chaperonin 10-like protein n=1 Tax=Mycena rosella TaxID=1033263 RepID=A0AAD7C0U3_MYCRO|nr:chaperonin 10-like protein [Mycena rosella]